MPKARKELEHQPLVPGGDRGDKKFIAVAPTVGSRSVGR